MESEEQFQQSLANTLVEETAFTVNVWVLLHHIKVLKSALQETVIRQLETSSSILLLELDLNWIIILLNIIFNLYNSTKFPMFDFNQTPCDQWTCCLFTSVCFFGTAV